MKTSNKILLGGLLTVILLLVTVHAVLYARYKAGYFTSVKDQDKRASNTKEFANARQIDIRYFKNVSIQVGDRMRIEPYGFKDNELVLTEKSGVVQLAPKDSASSDDLYGYVLVYVPENSSVTTHNAILRVEADDDGKKIQGLNFNINGGSLIFRQREKMVQIDSLNIAAANQADIEFYNARIDKLSVRLNASNLLDEEAVINQLKLQADSASRINLQSKNFLNITANTTAHE